MNTGIFAENAPDYWNANLPVMPLRENEKRPILAQWQKYCSQMPTDDERAQWLKRHPNSNLGLPLGPQSELCMIDVDTDDKAAITAIKALLPDTPWERRGKKGMALAFRWSGQSNFKIKGTDGTMLVELLGHGNQVVLPGSIHPDTRQPYTATCNLWEVIDQIPALPDGFEAKLRAELVEAGLAAPASEAPGSSKAPASGVEVIVPQEHGIERFLAQELASSCDEIAATKEGRNIMLFGKAKDMARHVAAAGADWAMFADKLEAAALVAGLEPGEIPATIASGWKAGSVEPTLWIPVACEHIYLGAQDRFYHPESGTYSTPTGFNGRFGRPHADKGTFAQFLTMNGFIAKVHDITYTPRLAPGMQTIDGTPYLNVYQPSDVAPVPGDAAPFEEFLAFLVPVEAERDHLMKVIAHTVRHPGERIRHAVLLRTRSQGVGKSIMFEIWGRLVGDSNVRYTSSREMSGNFDGWKTRNTLLICPELNIANGLAAYNDIKSFITDDVASINEKHLAQRRWPIFSTPVFSSNLEVPMLIEKADRRIFMIDSPATPRSADYYTEFSAWWRENLGVIRHHLDQVDLSDFNPHAQPPMTEAKQRLITRSANGLVQDLAHLIETRKGRLDRDVVTLQEVAFELGGNRVAERAIGNGLRELGGHSIGQQRVGAGRKSLWIIRNVDIWKKWGSAAQINEHLRSEGLFSDPAVRGLEDRDLEVAFLADLPGKDIGAMLQRSDKSEWMYL